MRSDLKHKVAGNSHKYYGYNRSIRSDRDLDFSPARTPMKKREYHEGWNQRQPRIDYNFVQRLAKGCVDMLYDTAYSDFCHLLKSHRYVDVKAKQYFKDQFNLEGVQERDGRLYRWSRWTGFQHEMWHGELYVNSKGVICSYIPPKPSEKKDPVEEKKKSEFIQGDKWFKKIKGIWFVADVVVQETTCSGTGYSKIYNVKHDFVFFDGGPDYYKLPWRWYAKGSGQYYTYQRHNIVIDGEIRYNNPANDGNLTAINKRTCNKQLLRKMGIKNC